MVSIVAPEAGQKRLAAETGEIHCHIGRATGAGVPLSVPQHGNGRLRGDAVDLAQDVTIQHEVAHHEDLQTAETSLEEAKKRFSFGQHVREGSG
jgi:hypothetical protein